MEAKVIRIEEPDFGCEGRQEGAPVMDKVILRKTGSTEEFTMKEDDAYLYELGIWEGDVVEVSEDKTKILRKVGE